MKRNIWGLVATLCLIYSNGALATTFYVDRNYPGANDTTNTGTSPTSPFLTVQKAVNSVVGGDTVYVRPGHYDEEIRTKSNQELTGTANTQPATITYEAWGNPTTRTDPRPRLKMFFLRHGNAVIKGFEFTGADGLWRNAVENKDVHGLQNVQVLNNYIHGSIYYRADNFNLSPNMISAPGANFPSAGYKAGKAFHIACDFDGNFNEYEYVSNLVIGSFPSNDRMTVTPLNADAALPPTRSNVFCFSQLTVGGILLMYVDGFTISGNIIEDMMGQAISVLGQKDASGVVHGKNGLVEKNELTNLHGYDAFRIFGENQIYRDNYYHDSPFLSGLGNHPDIFQMWGTEDLAAISRNITFEHNLIYNVESQLCQLNNTYNHNQSMINPGIRDWVVRNNVFALVAYNANIEPPGMWWYNNTYFKNGGLLSFGPPSWGSGVYNSVFISPNAENTSSGWYGSANFADDFYGDYNYVSGPPPDYLPKSDRCDPPDLWNFCEPHGINGMKPPLGGDPQFQNTDNVLGPDGIPWTQDDGLIPLNGSPFCNAGKDGATIGAYPCQGCTNTSPVAFFSMDKIEGWDPLVVELNASKSLSCSGTITSFRWQFDGEPDITTTEPIIFHTFHAGIRTVTLTVTNEMSRTATISKTLTVFPSLVPNLVFYLNMDDNVQDMSGRGHISEWQGDPAYALGLLGQAASYPSNTSPFIKVRHSADLESMEQLTVSLWAKKGAAGVVEILLTKHISYSLSLSRAYTGRDRLLATIYFRDLITGVMSSVELGGDLTGDLTQWHHYALTYDGTTASLFFDGNRIDQKGASGSIRRERRDIYLGKDAWDASGTFFGAFDEVRIYDRAFSEEDIRDLFHEANPSMPRVNAGLDQAVILPNPATLDATVQDDGEPNPPGTLDITWSKESGPGEVNFGNNKEADTTATFSQEGTYVLKLTAYDGEFTGRDTVMIRVYPDGYENQPPVVEAGTNRSVTFGTSLLLDATVTDDGIPNPPGTMTSTWTAHRIDGVGSVTFGNPHAIDTNVVFSSTGTFLLHLDVSDGVLSTFDELTVTVNPRPSAAPAAPSGAGHFEVFKTVFKPKEADKLTIRYRLDNATHVELKIHDRRGNEIKTLIDAPMAPDGDGINEVDWDGRNDKGDVVASGLYLLRLTTSGGQDKKKIMVVK